jgi:hypothetical protein
VKEVRKVLPELSFDELDFIVLLKQTKLLTVPKSVAMMYDFTNFPAPPDAGLRREISEIITEDGFAEMYPAIFYFPSAKIGFVNIQTQGNGACSVWRAFSVVAQGAHLAPRPQSMENGICADDGGNVYVGSIGNQPLVIETIDAQPISAGIAVIYVSSWTGTDWDGIATVTERQ